MLRRVLSGKLPWRLGLLVAVLGSVLASAPAHAQASSANARVLFREARKLMDRGRFEEACPKLEESLRLDHGMGTQFNLAHCWEKIGRTASAWGLFLDVASAASAAGQRKREFAARQRANALESRLTRLLIEVREPAKDLEVKWEGQVVGRAAWGIAMPIDPGPQRIEASAPGRRPWSTEVAVEAPGETVTVLVPPLEPEPVEAPPEPKVAAAPNEDAAAPERDEAPGMSTGRVVTATLLAAAGVAGVVAGTVYGLKANSETAEAEKLCVGGPQGNLCDRDQGLPDFDGGEAERSELRKHREDSDRAALISYVGWGVGAAGLVTSVIVLLTASEGGAEADSAQLRLAPSLGSGMIGTTLSGSF